AGEPDTYEVTKSSTAISALFAIAFSGRDGAATLVYQATEQPTDAPSPVSVALAGLDAAAGDDILWISTMHGDTASSIDGGAFTPPTDYISRYSYTDQTFLGANFSTRDNVSAGATGTLTGSCVLAAGNASYAGLVIAIPAASTAPTITSGTPSGSTTDRTPTAGFSVDTESGTGYVVMSQTAMPDITEAQIEAGTDDGDVALP